MVTEDFVSFEVARLLKEKGFDIPCDNYYDSSGKTPNESIYGGANIETLDYNADPFIKSGFPKFKTFSAPTQSIAMRWLREMHNIHIYTFYANSWIFAILDLETGEEFTRQKGYSSEEAVEAALKYCLTNLI